MCSIFGFNFSDKNLAKKMAKAMYHRGPDHKNIVTGDKYTIGYTRLSIIDLKNGNQPFLSKDGSKILFLNGEIYNYIELQNHLQKKGIKFKTNSDTEVLLKLYEVYGLDMFKQINGMFAFVIYDRKLDELVLGRDRLGIKPLYYYYDGTNFAFASEIKALLQADFVKRDINLHSLNNFLTFRYNTGSETLIKNISKVMPGHFLIFKNNNIATKKYWKISQNISQDNENVLSKKLYTLLNKSIMYRMRSDVPVGFLLSGGIDSSALVALASKFTEVPLKTFTLGFDDGFKNEFSDAKLVSEKFDTDHSEMIIGPDTLKHFEKIVWHLDEPLADPTSIPNYLLSKKASESVKVLINGDGADEIFGGYEQYRLINHAKQFSYIPVLGKKIIKSTLDILPKEPFTIKLNEFLPDKKITYKTYASLISMFSNSEKKKLLNEKIYNKVSSKDPYDYVKTNFKFGKDYFDNMLYNDINSFLTDNMLQKYDKLTMSSSVEGRVPFCDHNLVEFSFTVPSKYKLRGGNEKYILRKSMQNILPKQILKKKKQRFLVPTDNWHNRGLREHSEKIIDENSDTAKKYFDKRYINILLNYKKLNSARVLKINNLTNLYYSRQLWTLSTFLTWNKLFIDN